MWKEKSQLARDVLLSHMVSASSSDWPGAGRAKSTTMVVPPESAARVPLLEIVGGIGAHERHFEMGMRIDAAGHDITAGRIQRLVAREVRPDLDDPAAIDLDVGLVGEVGGDDGAVLDDCGHDRIP